MNILLNIILFALLIIVIMNILPTKGVKKITTSQLKEKLISKDIQFIDVRTPAEYKGRHIKEFKNLPLQGLAQKSDSLSKEKPVVVICQSGMRSKQACKTLKKLGFVDTTNVSGGMNSWR